MIQFAMNGIEEPCHNEAGATESCDCRGISCFLHVLKRQRRAPRAPQPPLELKLAQAHSGSFWNVLVISKCE